MTNKQKEIIQNVQETLFSLQDIGYRNLQSKLVPNVNKESIIGIRIPVLRKYAKEFSKTEDSTEYIKVFPHKYYEEIALHTFVIETIKDFDEAIMQTEKILPYIDNWAICDCFFPKVFKKFPEKILPYAKKWACCSDTYTIRYGIETLMKVFLDDNYSVEYPKLVSKIKSKEYYVNMMIAWYFATALSKQYDSVLPFIENKVLDVWTHNKTIQKSIESYRITSEQKEYLRTLKIIL